MGGERSGGVEREEVSKNQNCDKTGALVEFMAVRSGRELVSESGIGEALCYGVFWQSPAVLSGAWKGIETGCAILGVVVLPADPWIPILLCGFWSTRLRAEFWSSLGSEAPLSAG